jgi:hypothetical protein
MGLFFYIHNSIYQIIADYPMPENILEGFRLTGFKWLARTFAFKQCIVPKYITDLSFGLMKAEFRNLPTQ